MDYKVAICTIIKDEHQYLKEWINYHLSIGINEIFLYEDYNSKSHECITNNYKQVHLISFEQIENEITYNVNNKQIKVYDYFMKKMKNKIDWIAFIDVDEFIMFENGYDLQKLLNEYKYNNGVFLFYKIYNANGIIDNPHSPLLTTYTKESNYINYNQRGYFKSLINNKKNNTFISPHEISCGRTTNNMDNPKFPSFKKAWINHYFTRSWEEWCDRFLKRGDICPGNRKFEEFFLYNKDMLKDKVFLLQKYNEYKSKINI